MTELLSNILLVLGALVGALVLADLFLPDTYKKKIERATLLVWDKLDDLNKKPLLDRMNQTGWWFWATFALSVSLVTYAFVDHEYHNYVVDSRFPSGPLLSWDLVLTILAVIGLCALLAYLSVRWIVEVLAATDLQGGIVRVGLIFVSLLVCILLASYWSAMTPGAPRRFDDILVLAIVAGCFILLFWIVALVLRSLAQLVFHILRVLEFVIRRIAESSKGPLLAISAVASGIGGLLKTLQ
jgi:hypothetical protein